MTEKSDLVYDLVKGLLAEDVPIHGVGLQMHVNTTNYPDPDSVAANVRRLWKLGLKVNISEMDVSLGDLQGDLASKLEIQRHIYHDIISACVKEPGFIGVTTWGFTDACSWLDLPYGPDHPLVFDETYNPKPAHDGVRQALTPAVIEHYL